MLKEKEELDQVKAWGQPKLREVSMSVVNTSGPSHVSILCTSEHLSSVLCGREHPSPPEDQPLLASLRWRDLPSGYL